MNYATIRISAEVYRRLREMQMPRETYGEVIKRLLDYYEAYGQRRRKRGKKEATS